MAGLISPGSLDQIRAANDIVDVIGAVLPLKRAGANFVALCPFHKEKSPSFNVNPHRQIFHCFGCHKGGDVFTFVREYENLSFVEAVKRLAERANIPLELDNTPGQKEARHLKESLFQIHEQIAQRWQTALQNDASGQPARDYLIQRKVSDEAIRLFRLGFAPDAWDDTVNWARSRGHDLSIVEQAGLIIRKDQSDRYYDRFRGRVIFPICDEQGRVIAFSGRIISGDEKTAKYVNSPETPIFTKGKVFYGLDKAKRPILDAGFAIVCEGQLDLIACHMAGIRNVVAPQGTAFTPEHGRILKRYVEEVVLCFDSDKAGQNAAVRVFDSLLSAGLAIRVAAIPPPHDPDSFIQEHGGGGFQELIARAEGFFEFYLKLLCRTNDVGQDKGRLAVVREMAEALRKTNSAVLADTYAQKVALRLAVSPDAVRSEFRNAFHHSPMPASRESVDSPGGSHDLVERLTPVHPPSKREFWFLRFLLANDDHLDWVAQHMDLNWIEHPTLKRILAARITLHREGTWRGVASLIDSLEDPSAAALITQAVAESQHKGDMARNVMENLKQLRNDAIDRELGSLRLRLAEPGLTEAEAIEIQRRQGELRHCKQRPLDPVSVGNDEPF